MKKQLFILIPILVLSIVWSACDDYVTDVDSPIEVVLDEKLTDEGQVGFLINGVKTRFATSHDVLCVLVGLLSDEMFFDSNVPNATFPQFFDIDNRDMQYDNNSVDGGYDALGELRFFSDDLVKRAGEITFTNEAIRQEALFWGNLMGGVARHFYASYFGLNPTEGGGIISEDADNLGSFVPSADMYALALEKFDAAIQNAPDEAMARVANSLAGFISVLTGNIDAAAVYLAAGMVEGDEPFQSLHNELSNNYMWVQAGAGRTQAVVPQRFKDYVIEDPAELVRVPLDSILGVDEVTWYYRQGKYPTVSDPINLITWQINELLLASLDMAGTGLARVNAVRASYGIDPLDALDLETYLEELDKETCWQGVRVIIQNSFELWHESPGTWQYLPITQTERNINTNL